MSEKKYEVEYNKYTDRYEITEIDTSPKFYETDTNPTLREKLHEKLVNMDRGRKLFLTFFSIYTVVCFDLVQTPPADL